MLHYELVQRRILSHLQFRKISTIDRANDLIKYWLRTYQVKPAFYRDVYYFVISRYFPVLTELEIEKLLDANFQKEDIIQKEKTKKAEVSTVTW